jgi:hypothetical protein
VHFIVVDIPTELITHSIELHPYRCRPVEVEFRVLGEKVVDTAPLPLLLGLPSILSTSFGARIRRLRLFISAL